VLFRPVYDPNGYDWASTPSYVWDMLAKIQYAATRWKATLFYVDSNVGVDDQPLPFFGQCSGAGSEAGGGD
jgi:hypothetical protein